MSVDAFIFFIIKQTSRYILFERWERAKDFFVIMDHQSPLENSNNFLVKKENPKIFSDGKRLTSTLTSLSEM